MIESPRVRPPLQLTNHHVRNSDIEDPNCRQFDELEASRQALTSESYEHVGDPLSESKADNITRLYFQNINGVSWDPDGGRWPFICESMIGVQADIACFTEINTDTNQYRIRDAMEAICRRQFEQSRLIMSASKQVSRTAYKPGGTAILATNSITANIRHHSRDRMGRWSSVSLSTNTSKHIRIISAYQVCAGCRAGTFTASSQQYAQIMEESAATGSLARPTPRQSFISDLQQFINQVQQTEDIILVGDFNEEMSRPSSGIDNLATI